MKRRSSAPLPGRVRRVPRQTGSATGVALGGSLLATAEGGAGLRVGMAVGPLAYLTAAVLAWLCVPAKSGTT
ncbi:hypothetical protein ACFUJR_27195 [Streptomyces sp. NPDC057271]|uniref:hypothetical protein n=1 Tax=unclassified Streptomyces TaxID=2593676 RepID=UPI00362B1DC4